MQPEDEGVARSPPHLLARFGICRRESQGSARVSACDGAMGDPWSFLLMPQKGPAGNRGRVVGDCVIAGGSMKVGE